MNNTEAYQEIAYRSMQNTIDELRKENEFLKQRLVAQDEARERDLPLIWEQIYAFVVSRLRAGYRSVAGIGMSERDYRVVYAETARKSGYGGEIGPEGLYIYLPTGRVLLQSAPVPDGCFFEYGPVIEIPGHSLKADKLYTPWLKSSRQWPRRGEGVEPQAESPYVQIIYDVKLTRLGTLHEPR